MVYLDVIGKVRTTDLSLLFQPQMTADGTAVASVEALIRQNHAIRGQIGPAEILSSLRTVSQREALDWWVLGEACRVLKQWDALPVSVNINATQFRRLDFAKRFLSVLTELDVEPRRIEIEILEAAFIKDFDAASANIGLLREAGVRVALDDFGTGYSSLAYLLKMPIDKLKIDKSFVDGIGSMRAASIIQAVVALARAIGLKVTAEGVETTDQQRFLKAVGCHYLQGYLFSPPTTAHAISRMLELHGGRERRDVA